MKEQFKDDPIFLALDKMDQLSVFQDYIRDLERNEEEKKRLEIQTQKREARKCRDAFRVKEVKWFLSHIYLYSLLGLIE